MFIKQPGRSHSQAQYESPTGLGLIPIVILTAILFLSLGDYRHLDPETGEPLAR